MVKDEWYLDFREPPLLIEKLKKSNFKADIFTFGQRPPEVEPKYSYFFEWDNIAAIQIKSFDHWWSKQIKAKTRNMIRKAEKCGVVVKEVHFSDEFVKGIQNIYNETPIRQGKPFWHYGKDFVSLRDLHATYLDRSEFLGAYYNNELVGFIKLVYAGETANTMHIISKIEHRNKAPVNALVAKAVEVCYNKNISYLVYDKFDYGKSGSDGLVSFKRHNGFKKIELPRYYIPLSVKGRIILWLKLHHGIAQILPDKLVAFLIALRNKWYLRICGNVRNNGNGVREKRG
jgi:hypothetical protein